MFINVVVFAGNNILVFVGDAVTGNGERSRIRCADISRFFSVKYIPREIEFATFPRALGQRWDHATCFSFGDEQQHRSK